MTENKPPYNTCTDQVILDALLEVLSPDQLLILSRELTTLISNQYGTFTIKVEGSQLYFVRSTSIKAGKIKK